MIEVVKQQTELGIDIPGDGEFGKAMRHKINDGAWWSYSFQRLGGLELTNVSLAQMPPRRSKLSRWS